MKHLTTTICLMIAVLLGSVGMSCAQTENSYKIATLYRDSSPDIPSDRYHVATFNADHGYSYNRENCQIAAKLFQEQPGVKTRF
jgi:hypothetical protein